MLAALRRLFARSAAAPRPSGRIALRTGSVVTEIGPGAILHALCSTIATRLEPDGWGTRFPRVMGALYQGHLGAAEAPEALREAREIAALLEAVPVDAITWDIDRPGEAPPAAYVPMHGARSAATWFRTVNGLDLLRDGLVDALESAAEFGHAVEVIPFDRPADAFRPAR
jgi:hypothetical protein